MASICPSKPAGTDEAVKDTPLASHTSSQKLQIMIKLWMPSSMLYISKRQDQLTLLSEVDECVFPPRFRGRDKMDYLELWCWKKLLDDGYGQ